jgi:acyl dehydratase
VGDRVRDHVELLDARRRRPGQILVSTRHTFEVEGRSKPVLVADWLALMLSADAEMPQ